MKNTVKKLIALVGAATLSVTALAGCGVSNSGGNSDKIKITVSVSGTDASEGELMQKWKCAKVGATP